MSLWVPRWNIFSCVRNLIILNRFQIMRYKDGCKVKLQPNCFLAQSGNYYSWKSAWNVSDLIFYCTNKIMTFILGLLLYQRSIKVIIKKTSFQFSRIFFRVKVYKLTLTFHLIVCVLSSTITERILMGLKKVSTYTMSYIYKHLQLHNILM